MKKLCVNAALGLVIFIAVAFSLVAQDICREKVATSEGPVLGAKAAKYAACEFKGIPFAAAMRWKAPASPANHSNVFKAVKFGPSCLQNESYSSGGKSDAFSEDCLTLNIYRPAKTGTFPVMFWIYGGGYTQGGNGYGIYHGAHLAGTRDVVVVTVNYRLGPFGFLALPSLAAEDANHSTGNYGLLDMIAALKWVKANIKSFGGDPDNVTIFGESAGGVSVCSLLASKPAAGLFSRAIIESGACDMAMPAEKGFKESESLASKLGCNKKAPLPCLRAKSAQDLLQFKGSGFTASAHIDGYVLTASPIDLLKKGEFNKVPVMVGSNHDEMNIILMTMPGAMSTSKAKVIKMMKDNLGSRADEVLKLYSFSDYRKPIFLVGAVFADGFGSRAFAAAEGISAYTPTYYYRFDWHDEALGKTTGSFHGLELPFVFGNLDAKRSALHLVLTKRAVKSATPLSEKMMTYWTNFAKTGNPNSADLSAWPKYDTTKRGRIYLSNEVTSGPLTAKEIERYQYFAALTMEDLAGARKIRKRNSAER